MQKAEPKKLKLKAKRISATPKTYDYMILAFSFLLSALSFVLTLAYHAQAINKGCRISKRAHPTH